MVRCAISTCNNKSKRTIAQNVKYFRFPTDINLRTLWFQACGSGSGSGSGSCYPMNNNRKKLRICSDHFTSNDYNIRNVQKLLKKRLKKDAIPSVNVVVQSIKAEPIDGPSNNTINTYEEVAETRIIPSDDFIYINGSNQIKCEPLDIKAEYIDADAVCNLTNDVAVQTTIDNEYLQRTYKMTNDIEELKGKLQRQININNRLRGVLHNLRTFFTQGQIDKLLAPNNNGTTWSSEDLLSAYTLYATGATGYKYLYKKGYPLPAPSTMRNWVRDRIV